GGVLESNTPSLATSSSVENALMALAAAGVGDRRVCQTKGARESCSGPAPPAARNAGTVATGTSSTGSSALGGGSGSGSGDRACACNGAATVSSRPPLDTAASCTLLPHALTASLRTTGAGG